MKSDIASLEAKISQVVALCQGLRAQNGTLRSQLNAATDERDRLAAKLEAARLRLEMLAEQLPDN